MEYPFTRGALAALGLVLSACASAPSEQSAGGAPAATTASTAPAAPPAADAVADPDRVQCEAEQQTGSRIQRKVCRSQRQRDRDREDVEAAMAKNARAPRPADGGH